MRFDLMHLQLHLILKYNKLGLETVARWAQIMLLAEMLLQHVVVAIVVSALFLAACLADVALLVPITHVDPELVIAVKVLMTELTVAVLAGQMRLQ